MEGFVLVGGLGGFFPPLVLGLIRQYTGTFTFGFVLLALFALCCLAVCGLTGRNSAKKNLLAICLFRLN